MAVIRAQCIPRVSIHTGTSVQVLLAQASPEQYNDGKAGRLGMRTKQPSYLKRGSQRELQGSWDAQSQLKHNLVHNPTSGLARLYLLVSLFRRQSLPEQAPSSK